MKANNIVNIRHLKTLARRYRRRLFESLGSEHYSRPGDLELDKKLASYLPERGFFIEAGANDGFEQSNTYYLERFKGWKGVLIEPIPELYLDCVKERSNSKVFNCALVSRSYPDTTITMQYGHLMSLVKNTFSGTDLEEYRLKRAEVLYQIKSYEIVVPARTLTSILDEVRVSKIDFFSLDVEGFELAVLQGLDFSKYRPKYMLIECLDNNKRKEIEAYVANFYSFIEQLSYRDYLYQSKE